MLAARQVELARSIGRRAKVYLDANFWITVRDAEAGTDARKAALFDLLLRGVSDGTLLCPISESTFLEVMKQAPTRRIPTARTK